MKYGFMPGCSLASTSPENVQHIINYLQDLYPDLAIIEACCGKPMKMIGETEKFENHFANLAEMVRDAEIDDLLLACQNCLKVMTEEKKFKVDSLWVKMAEWGLPEEYHNKAKDSDVVFSIQDSCSARDRTDVQRAVRQIMKFLVYKVARNRLSLRNTLCCGFGGMCGVSNAQLSHEVARKRVQTFKTDYVVSYCSSCTLAMSIGGARSWHLLDLIFGPVVHLGDQPKPNDLGNTLKAWQNRYRTKKIIQKA